MVPGDDNQKVATGRSGPNQSMNCKQPPSFRSAAVQVVNKMQTAGVFDSLPAAEESSAPGVFRAPSLKQTVRVPPRVVSTTDYSSYAQLLSAALPPRPPYSVHLLLPPVRSVSSSRAHMYTHTVHTYSTHIHTHIEWSRETSRYQNQPTGHTTSIRRSR